VLLAAAVAVVGAGLVAPATFAELAAAQGAPDARLDQLATELGGLDDQVAQLAAALQDLDRELDVTTAERDDVRAAATNREQVEAQLAAQASAYAVQRYMYGSTDGTDLLAFVAALSRPADDAVWGLAALEVAAGAAEDRAEQVASVRAAIAKRLAALDTDVLNLRTARARRAQELDDTTAQRSQVALQFAALVRDLGQATVNGMTTVAYYAYLQAAETLALEQPGCGLRWELLAAIGKTESNHGAGRLDAFGNSVVAIVGIPIGPDTDGGLLDGDTSQDHAVGPMQFLPSTWARWGTDANHDGKSDPGNVVDAAMSAARYLCRAAGALTLTSEAGVTRAILAYNPNQAYLRVVGARFEALASDLARGWFSAASLPPAPAAPDIASNGGPNGRPAPGATPLPAPPQTTVNQVQVFTADGLAIAAAGPETAGRCLGPSLALSGRDGFLRCQPAAGAVLDPCQAAPYDATLVGCLPDPTAAPVLVRLATAAATAALGSPPPFRLLVLDGGDRCLPIPAPEPPPAEPSPTSSTTTSTMTATSSPRPTTTSATTSIAPPLSTDAPTTAAGRSSTTATTEAPSTPGTATRRTKAAAATTDAPVGPATTDTSTTTTTTPATTTSVAPTTTTLPLAERPTYACAGGATIIGVPDASSPAWTVLVRQPGLADRQLTVVRAYA
jgi:membrane-bound lytic murein transglycosylase B